MKLGADITRAAGLPRGREPLSGSPDRRLGPDPRRLRRRHRERRHAADGSPLRRPGGGQLQDALSDNRKHATSATAASVYPDQNRELAGSAPWPGQDSNLRATDYESAALTN